MDISALLAQLSAHPPDGMPREGLAARLIQENVFQARAGGQDFFVKWIAAGNAHGQNELRIGRAFARLKTIPAPRMIFEQAVEGGVIAGWEWIQGHDLRQQDRQRLPQAFARLGQIHRQMRNANEVTAPLGSARYATIREMLAAEIYRLTAPFEAPVQTRCQAIIARLEAGYPTLIHGDMHPGNLLLQGERVWIVDWSYACNSLNLFDLDYILSAPLAGTGPAWSLIRGEEAGPVLAAYFQAAGMENVDIPRMHLAVMVWNLLRTHENAMLNGYRAEAQQVREQLLNLLNHPDTIESHA